MMRHKLGVDCLRRVPAVEVGKVINVSSRSLDSLGEYLIALARRLERLDLCAISDMTDISRISVGAMGQ